MSGDDSFAQLLSRVRAGDAEAAEELVRRYEPTLRRMVHVRLVSDRLRRLFDAEDICQSVLASFFVRAALGQFELATPEDLLKLLATMARNKVVNKARRADMSMQGGERVPLSELSSSVLAGSDFFLGSGSDCGQAPDGAYELVYSQLCFRYITSRSVRNDLMRAMARALRPGGVVVVEMRFFPGLAANSIPSPHVPWSADEFEPAGDAGQVDVCPTPDELHLVYADFAKHFDDVRLQFVDVPKADRHHCSTSNAAIRDLDDVESSTGLAPSCDRRKLLV